MKTTTNLTIHAPSKKAAKFCLEYLLVAWDALHRSGDAPVNTFLEYGDARSARRKRRPCALEEMTKIEVADKEERQARGGRG